MWLFLMLTILSIITPSVHSTSQAQDDHYNKIEFIQKLRSPTVTDTMNMFLFFGSQMSNSTSYLRNTKARIFNGVRVNNNNRSQRYRYFALLSSGGSKKFFCGGVLIADNTVLTAAHCSHSNKIRKVIIGIYDLRDDTSTYETFDVRRTKIPSDYDPRRVDNDFMLVVFDGKSEFSPICMATNEDFLDKGDPLRIIGFGVTETWRPSVSMLKANVEYISENQCKKRYREWEKNDDDDAFDEDWRPKITDNMICADSKEGSDACHGDSGGPLIYQADDSTGNRDVLVGLVSWGIGCSDYPGVYSRISSKAKYIKKKVKKYGGKLPNCGRFD